jgi:exosortase
VLLDHIVVFLQKGSTEAVDGIFTLTTLPVKRDGFNFALSHIEIEVAVQCSGIRSGLYLLLTGLVMGQFFLKTTSRRILLVLAVVPISIFKNGLRIVTLSLLGNYVSPSILSSNLHRQGGIPFMILAVILLSIVVRWLRKSDKHAASGDSPVSANTFSRKGGDASPA